MATRRRTDHLPVTRKPEAAIRAGSVTRVEKDYRDKFRYGYELEKMEADGWRVESTLITQKRRVSFLAWGLIGYWLLPRLKTYHVTYVRDD